MVRNKKDTQDKKPADSASSSDGSDMGTADSTYSWRRKLDSIIYNYSSKIIKALGITLLELFAELQEENDELPRKIAYLLGRVDERQIIG